MRQVIGLLLIIGAIWGCKELYKYWDTVKARKQAEDRGGAPPPTAAATPTALPGLPSNLESTLLAAQSSRSQELTWLRSPRRMRRGPEPKSMVG